MSIAEVSVKDTPANPAVVDKYKACADIINKALKKVVDGCIEGAKVMELCVLGDKTLEELLKSVYAKAKVSKGIAFPTSISVNNCVCHFSPTPEDSEEPLTLNNGDVAKIEMAAHIDGFPVVVGHTVVVGASKKSPVSGKKADALQAAHIAAEACLRLFKDGKKMNQVAETVQKIAEMFGCNSLEGMTSYSMSKNNMEGEKQVVLVPTEEQRKSIASECFKEGEVYAVNVVISTGEGKAKQGTTRTNIYRKTNTQYQLKMKAARVLLNDVKDRFGNFAFTMRSFEDIRKARMGLHETVAHHVLQPFDVYYEKEGEVVAQFIFTTLLHVNGPIKLTGLEFDQEVVKSEKEIADEEIKALLAEPVKKKKSKKPVSQ